jgi:undecaprenyl diphosphate synthase
LDQSRARHVAIIMDGNGRWAKKRGLPRAVGHQRGVEAVRRLVRALAPTGLECLTLYAFSSENWKRSEDEVDDLMNLMRKFIKSDLPEFVANNVKLKIIGDWQSLAPDIVAMLEDALAQTANGSQTLAVALNYGAQHEIARAAAKVNCARAKRLPELPPRLVFRCVVTISHRQAKNRAGACALVHSRVGNRAIEAMMLGGAATAPAKIG